MKLLHFGTLAFFAFASVKGLAHSTNDLREDHNTCSEEEIINIALKCGRCEVQEVEEEIREVL
jgi:hypothetical protein